MWSNPCPKCRGTGRFTSWAGRDVGPCHTCKGKGVLEFATSPEQRAKARASTSARKARVAADATEAFAAEHPDQWAWITKKHSDGFGFAISLREGIAKYGSLTDGQMAAVDRLIAKDAERTQARAERAVQQDAVDLSGIIKTFATAHGNGLKAPILRTNGMTLSLAKPHSANAGWVYAKRGDTYLGKISPEGKWRPVREATTADEVALVAIAADPLQAALAYAKETKACACCGILLTDPVSVARGIGPICKDKWGM